MSKKILIVDDEPNVRLNYRVTLETEGLTVAEAGGGAQALTLLEAERFDLAVLDLRMPEMDGLELLAAMRQRGISTPAVIITAYGDIPHAVRAMKLGAIDFLKKPITPAQLRQVTKELLDRHERPTMSDSDPSTNRDTMHDYYLQQAKRLLNLQDFDPARVNLAKAMEIDPFTADAFNLAGVLFEMQEDYDRAKQYYSHAIKLDKNYEPAQQNLRRVLEPSHAGSTNKPFAMGDD